MFATSRPNQGGIIFSNGSSLSRWFLVIWRQCERFAGHLCRLFAASFSPRALAIVFFRPLFLGISRCTASMAHLFIDYWGTIILVFGWATTLCPSTARKMATRSVAIAFTRAFGDVFICGMVLGRWYFDGTLCAVIQLAFATGKLTVIRRFPDNSFAKSFTGDC